MKRLSWHTWWSTLVAIVLLVPLLSACDASSVINQDLSQDCINGSCLTFTTWAQNIDALINKQAVGYAYIIMNHGLLMAKNAFGQAHTATDPPATAMSVDVSSNIASVTKTITAVAVLKLLAAKGVSVTSPIYPYLPSSWTLGPNVKTITFAELLTHTSGIRETFSPNTDTTYANLQQLIQQGILLSNKVYSYQNANFALFRILIPYLNGFNDAGVADIAAATDQGYQDYLNSVYSPDFPITCTPPAASMPPEVLSYSSPTAHGPNWGDFTDLCGDAGLQLSVMDMAVFLAHLTLGAYLPAAPQANTLASMVSNMYGWDFTWPNTHGTCVEKNGDLGGGTPYVPYLSTLVVYCPTTGLGFVGMANSTLPAMPTHSYGFVGALDDIVYDAYTASWHAQA
jgi:CubicO group peptidase (beta-lactamase class C family)